MKRYDLFKIKYSHGVVIAPQKGFKQLDDLDQLEMLVAIEKEFKEYRDQILSGAWKETGNM